MKKNIHLTALLALAGSASAFAVTPGSSGAATIALVETFQVPALKEGKELVYEKYTSKENKEGDLLSETFEWKAALKTYKFGNKELLTELKDQSLLDGTITGWSIVAIDSGDGEEGDVPSFYAVKKGKSPVPVDFFVELGAEVEAYSGKETYDFVKEKGTYTESGSGKAEAWFELGSYSGKGLLSFTFKYASGTLGKGEAAEYYGLFLSSGKLANIVGNAPSEEGDNLVEGSITIGAGKVVDLETLGFGL